MFFFLFPLCIFLPFLSSRKLIRFWLIKRSSTSWSFSQTKARCPLWWRAPKTPSAPPLSPRTRFPTPNCTGATSEWLRGLNAPSGPASSAPSGRPGKMGSRESHLLNSFLTQCVFVFRLFFLGQQKSKINKLLQFNKL